MTTLAHPPGGILAELAHWTVKSVCAKCALAAAGLVAQTRALGLLLAVAMAAPLVVLAAGAWVAWGQVWRQTEMELGRSADAAAAYAVRLLDGQAALADRADDLLAGLSDGQIREHEAELHAALQHLVAAGPAVLALDAIDADGRPLVSATRFPVPRDAELRDRGFFAGLHGTATPDRYVGAEHAGRADGRPFVSVARPRSTGLDARLAAAQGQRFGGVVVALLRPEELARQLGRVALEAEDALALVRSDGELLAGGREFLGDGATADGSGHAVALRRVEDWPVYASAARPRAAVIARWQQAVAWQTALAIPAVIGLAGLVVCAGRRSRQACEAGTALRIAAERLAAAEALHESAARLRTATKGAGLGVCELDYERRAIWFDACAAAMVAHGLPAETWLPLGGPEEAAFAARIHPEDRAGHDAALASVARGAVDRIEIEYRLRDADGGWAWVNCHRRVLDRDPHSGLPRRAIGIVRDVSARHRLEAELRHGQKLQALGELAGGIAHDFNNVLQAVGCGAALIEEFPDNAEAVRRRARMLAGVVERGASITHRLLSLARRGDLHTDAVDPDDLLQGLRAILIPSLTACIEVRVEPTAALPPLLADRAQLETALINLATNARDAMPDGGTLSFSAAEERVEAGDAPARLAAGRYVRLCVRDTGMGIPPAMLARVQEPFFTTKPDGAGTGLGLSMVKDFAERSGGGFAIASVPGEGTMVTLWFPQVMEAIVGEAAAGEAVAGEAAGRAGT